MSATQEATPGPVFVGGTGRSGTTVLGQLIGTHPRFAYIPVEMRFHAEPQGLPGLLDGKVELDDFLERMRTHWLRRAVGPTAATNMEVRYRGLYRILSGDQLDTALERFEEGYGDDPVVAARDLVQDLTRPTLRDAIKPSFVEMTPNNMLAVKTLLQLFPDARVVHSLRDGRDVAASLVSRGLPDMETALNKWALRLERFHRRNVNIPPDRLHLVSLYDLVLERREECYARLVDFLGVPDSRMMREFFDTRMSPESAHIGRWRGDTPPDRQREIDDHYHRLIGRLASKGIDVAALGQQVEAERWEEAGPEAGPSAPPAAPEPEVLEPEAPPEPPETPAPAARPSPMPFAGSLLWVNPRQINLLYGGGDQRQATRRREEVVDGDWDTPRATRFDETDIYKALEGHLVHNQPWEETPFYSRVTAALARGERKFNCGTTEEFKERRELIDRLYALIRNNGYRTQTELGTRRAGDEIRVAIGRDGRFLFLDGRHRLSIARILGLPRVPVQVTMRHAEWEAFREKVWEYARRRDGRVYQIIDHPDLADVPAHHGTERVDMITAALSGFDPAGKRLLDIGTHWGYMARAMEKLGFVPTGVEYNRKNAAFAERLTVACESGMSVWSGNIFEFPDPEDFQVVLALNIFHHLIRTEEQHANLIEFLGRLRNVELIFFEAHLSEGHQLRGAYRNYPSEEFAQFVAEHAGLSNVEYLGAAADGRSLFKISR